MNGSLREPGCRPKIASCSKGSTGAADAIAAACLAAVPPDDAEGAVWMLAGSLTCAGDRAVWEALSRRVPGMPSKEEGPSVATSLRLHIWADRFGGAAPGIARMLRQLADERSERTGQPPGRNDPRLPGLS